MVRKPTLPCLASSNIISSTLTPLSCKAAQSAVAAKGSKLLLVAFAETPAMHVLE